MSAAGFHHGKRERWTVLREKVALVVLLYHSFEQGL